MATRQPEKLLHYVWKHRLLPPQALLTTDGRTLEVVDPGMSNNDAGPDFFNAKVRLGDTMWAGNVELHLQSSDWYRHGHNLDHAYDNVVLHVAQVVDTDVQTCSGKPVPQLQLQIPDTVRANYDVLCTTDDYPRCWRIIRHLPPLKVHAWMDALLCERLTERAQRVLDRLDQTGGDWERAFFITLARNFGFGINGDAFELWARRVSLNAAAKHRDNIFQLEALFLGTAGMLKPDSMPQGCRDDAARDAYYQRLQREYDYLRHRFSLPASMGSSQWKYLRLRPQNFPHIRLVQLAWMYHQGHASLSAVLDAADADALRTLLQTQVSEYWHTHYLPGQPTAPNPKQMSRASQHLLIINTVAPVLYAYGLKHGSQAYQERAVQLLESLPAEGNYIIRQWHDCGLQVASAADSQALIQLKREYCDRRYCLRCRFGYEYLKSSHSNE